MALQELASLLPALDDTKESLLSKHIIVQESIKQHQSHQAAMDEAERQLLIVTAERDALRLQLEQCLLVPCETAVNHQPQPGQSHNTCTGQLAWTPPPSGLGNTASHIGPWDGNAWSPTNCSPPEAVIGTLSEPYHDSLIT